MKLLCSSSAVLSIVIHVPMHLQPAKETSYFD